MKGVVINYGKDIVPNDSAIINMTNKTSFIEAVGIMNNANGYIGIDTCWSTLASQRFDSPQLAIKSVNKQCYQEQHIYFASKSKFDFMGKSISEVLQRY